MNDQPRQETRLLPSIQRDFARRRLSKLLSIADDAAFCRMIWAVDTLQEGRARLAAEHLNFPYEAIGADFTSPYRVYEWTMETLVNELLTIPKRGVLIGRRNRFLKCSEFAALADVVNTLNDLEDAESGLWLLNNSVRLEMHRIAQRQFHWQRGFLNIPQFYRSARLFNFPDADTFFNSRYGLSIAAFARCGFTIYAQLSEHPFMAKNIDFSSVGVAQQETDATLRMISIAHAKARKEAQRLRAGRGQTAYKPSVLRRYPCIRFGKDGNDICAPIRELIAERVTSGVFYDLVGASGSLRNAVSRNFEDYSKELFEGFLPGLDVIPESSYNDDQNRTPDLILRTNGSIFAIIECKATKMPLPAKFSDQPLEEAERAYSEIEKGVFQIWRFASHKRRGVLDVGGAMRSDAVGVVLTLDSWLEAFGDLRQQIVQRAKEYATRRDPLITAEDMIPLIFCPIDDMEFTLSRASESDFRSALLHAASPKYTGYHLSAVFKEVCDPPYEQKPYPFKNRVQEVLPWWGSWRPQSLLSADDPSASLQGN